MTTLDAADMAAIRAAYGEKPQILRQIVEAVADATGVSADAILGESRVRRIARARQIVMFVAHRQGLSLTEIGQFLRRDHTSVLHGVRQEAERRQA